MIANHLVRGIKCRGDMGIDPVMITLFAHIHDIGKNLVPGGNFIPQHFENAARHIGVTDKRMGLTKDFLFTEVGQIQKQFVGIGNPTFKIGLADDQFFWFEMAFLAGRLNT